MSSGQVATVEQPVLLYNVRVSETLLQTKLFVPPLRPNLVPRQRLIERLNQGLQLGHKLTLISAPAGFGKSTLASEWVANSRRTAAWLSLDAADNDPARFLTYLVAALHEAAESGLERAVAALNAPQPLPPEAILTAVVNDLTAVEHNFILFLDDYHLIDSQPIDNALTFLLEHQPPQMHLVIATREDPQLPLARLRARGQLTEVRAADLRFTADEATIFLNQSMGLTLTEDEILALENRTEGWIAGLQLAALSVRGRDDSTGFIKAFAGDNRYIVDYLLAEVLERQPEHVRSFLLHTAILDRLNGSLCDAVRFGETHGFDETPNNPSGKAVTGQEMLDRLERGNLFVIPLDDKRRWYRYHHLFADVLHDHLMEEQPDLVPDLHRRASAWYEAHNQQSAAIRHALAAKDYERAAGLAELTWPAWSGSFQSIAWLGWLKALPDELVRVRPVLCMAYVWANLNAGDLEAAGAWLRAAERWLDPAAGVDGDPAQEMVVVDEDQFHSLPVSLATARAYHAKAIGDLPATVKYARQVIELASEEDVDFRQSAAALQGLAEWESGDLEEAQRTMATGLADMGPLDLITGTFVLADICLDLGRLGAAQTACEHALRLAAAFGEPAPIGTEDVYSALSKVHREQGDLAAAAQDLQAGKKLGDQVELPDWRHRWCVAQARLKQSQGELDAALDLLDEAQRVFVRTPVPDVHPIAASKARVWAAQGRMAEALGWARERGLKGADDLSYPREFEHITLARVLFARFKNDGDDGALHETADLLQRLLPAAEDSKRMGSVIEILALLALVQQELGDTTAALDSLERALAAAEPEGYVRMFVDEGRPMFRLLHAAASRGMAPDYVQRLLASFGPATSQTAVPPSARSESRTPRSELVEPLSEREIEVLQLIAEGLSNQEIANRLYVSLNTVKVHTRNIYGKLGVNSRTQAVARARALGQLPST